jgi:hypothetical protein
MSTIRVSEPAPGVLVQEGLEIHPHVARHYARLVGRKIVNVQLEVDTLSGSHDPMVILVFEDDSCASILCDPEGNGPGHIELHDA